MSRNITNPTQSVTVRSTAVFTGATSVQAQVNLALQTANTALSVANGISNTASYAANTANAAYAAANSGLAYSSAAYNQSNLSYTLATSAYSRANVSANIASAAYDQANATNTYAASAYATANAAIANASISSNVIFAKANIAYNVATAAYTQANAAFDSSNTKVSKSGDTITGSLTIQGQANVYQRFSVGTGSYTVLPNLISQFTGTSDQYSQVNQQNLSGNGTGDFVVTSNDGTDIVNYIDMGIAGNTYNNTTFNALPFVYPNDGYFIMVGNPGQAFGGNVYYGTAGSGGASPIGDIVFVQGQNFTEVARFKSGQGLQIKSGTNAANTVSGALTVAGGVGISGALYANSVYDGTTRLLTAINTANTFLQANDAATLLIAKTYTDTANSYLSNSITYINGVNTYQNTFIQAAFNTANNAFANSAVNTAYLQGIVNTQNTNIAAINTYSISAYSTANGAYAQANAANNLAQAAFDTANAIITQSAAGAFRAANNAANLAQYAANTANSAQANTIYTQGVDLYQNTVITAVNNLATFGYYQANQAFIQANAAFSQANAANNLATSGYAQANAAFINAGAAFGKANVVDQYATSAYGQANAASNLATSAYYNSNQAFIQANAAFAVANAAIPSVGGFVTGALLINTGSSTSLTSTGSVYFNKDLYVTGNLYINGNTTTFSSNNLSVNTSIIYLAANNTANIIDIGLVGHFITDHYQHTGMVRNHNDGKWKFFSNVLAEPSQTINWADANIVYDAIQTGGIFSPTATINGLELYSYSTTGFAQANAATNSATAAYFNANQAFIQANASFAQANAANNLATSGYAQANAATNSATNGYFNANQAFIQANAAFAQANSTNTYAFSAFAQANSTNTYAFSAFAQANAANNLAISGYAQANATNSLATFAYYAANQAFIQANAAFLQANVSTSGYNQANAANNLATSAYYQANQSFIQANAAFAQANAANNLARSAYTKANGAVQTGFTTITANGSSITPSTNTDTLTITAALANGISVLNPSSKTIDFGLLASGVTASSYGTSTAIPQIAVDKFGRITSATTIGISTTLNLNTNYGSGSVGNGGTLNVAGSKGITTSIISSNNIVINNLGVLTLNVAATSRLTANSSNGDIQIDLATVPTVLAGTYSYPSLSVDSYGRITTISSQTPITSVAGVSGGPVSNAQLIAAVTNVTNYANAAYTQAAFDTANAAFVAANTAGSNTVYLQSINDLQNTAIISAYAQANAANNLATSAYATANAAAQITANAGNTLTSNTITANVAFKLPFSTVTTVQTYANNVGQNNAIDSFSTSAYRSAVYDIQAVNASGYEVTKLLVLQNDVDAFVSEFGSLTSYGSTLGSFTANVVSGVVNLNFIPKYRNTFLIVSRTALSNTGIASPIPLNTVPTDLNVGSGTIELLNDNYVIDLNYT